MEQITKTVEQVLNSYEGLSNVEPPKSETEVSVYGKGKVTSNCLALGIVKLKRAFPKLNEGWYLILEEMLDEERFTDQRLNDAINNLIKTCAYPEPTIANILSYDKKAKFWTYDEALAYSNDFSVERRKKFWDSMELVDKNKKLWVMKSA